MQNFGDFITWWFSNVKKALGHSNSYFEIRIISDDKPKQYWFQTPESAIQFCEKYQKSTSENVYFGLQPRKQARGRTEDIEALVFCGIDFDTKNKDKKTGTPEEDYKDICRWASYELFYFIEEGEHKPPYCIIGSGNGIQLFYAHTPQLPTPPNLKKHADKTIQSGNNILACIPHPLLYTDEVKDGARVLRLVGFENTKGGRSSDILYLKEETKKTQEIDFKVPQTSRSLEKALEKKIGSQRRYFYFTYLGGLMASHDVERDEAEKMLRKFNIENCDEPAPDYYIENALSSYDRWLKNNKKFSEQKDKGKSYEDFVKEVASCTTFNELEEIYGHFCKIVQNATTQSAFKKEIYKIGVPNVVLSQIPIVTTIENEELFVFNGNGIWEIGEYKINEILEKQNKDFRAKIKFTTGQKTELLSQVKHRTYESVSFFDNAPPYFLPVKNGILDLRTLELRDYNCEDHFTKKLGVNYDPEAKCERFEQFLHEVSVGVGRTQEEKDEHQRKMVLGLKQLIGYCLWRDYPIQKMFFLVGAGANGKGVFLTILQKMFGIENVSSVSAKVLADDKFAPAELHTKLVNLSSELTGGTIKNMDFVKSLTGGDLITAQKKFRHPFNFVNYAKLLIASNHPPKIDDASIGFYRRVHLFDFLKTFLGKDADKGLVKELTSEESLSGILNVGLAELSKWIDEKGNFKVDVDFANSMPVEDIKLMYELRSDPINAFIFDCVITSSDTDAYVPKEEVFDYYKQFCTKRNLQSITPMAFSREFKKKTKLAETRRTGDQGETPDRCWFGLKINKENIEIQSKDTQESHQSSLSG